MHHHTSPSSCEQTGKSLCNSRNLDEGAFIWVFMEKILMTFSMRFEAPLVKSIFSASPDVFVGVVPNIGRTCTLLFRCLPFSPRGADLPRVEENLWVRKVGEMSFRETKARGIKSGWKFRNSNFSRDAHVKTSMQMGPQTGVEFETSRLKWWWQTNVTSWDLWDTF